MNRRRRDLRAIVQVTDVVTPHARRQRHRRPHCSAGSAPMSGEPSVTTTGFGDCSAAAVAAATTYSASLDFAVGDERISLSNAERAMLPCDGLDFAILALPSP